jgi:hypothetical protein
MHAGGWRLEVGCRIVEEARQPFYDVYILSL